MYEQACESAFALSCWELGLLLKKGLGTPADPVKAKALLTRACKLGHEKACAAK